MQTINEILAEELGQRKDYVENVVTLLDEGNTVPFIARYRKEMHGAMDDQAIRTLADRLAYLRNLETRRQEVKTSIENQGKLTEELSRSIDEAKTLAEVEDIYRPYKQKRRTRATVAREKGLAPLAELLYAQQPDCPVPLEAAKEFADGETVATAEEALAGASDIVAEMISDDAEVRKDLRVLYNEWADVVSSAAEKDPADTVYRNICYGLERTVTQAEVEEAARRANIAADIQRLPGAYQFRLSEGGRNLSGGQRQRLALARIFLRRPKILILDEATSALDNTSEKYIQAEIEKMKEEWGTTVISIAHRLTTLQNCDEILVMDAGQIVQRGTFQDLSRQPGIFRDMARGVLK